MRIIFRNLLDDAALNASPAMHYNTPVTNLQDPAREKVVRTTGLSTQTIDVTLSKAAAISACVIYRGNFTADATWRVKVYDTPAMGTLLYDSGDSDLAASKTLDDLDWGVDPLGASLFDGWGYMFAALWFEQVIGSFVRVTLSDSSNTDGYMEASRLFVGTYFETIYAPRNGMWMGWRDTSTQQRTEGGTLRTEAGAMFRAMALNGDQMPEADRVALSEMLRQAGLRDDLYVSAFPELGNALERDHQMQAKFVSLDPTVIARWGYVNQTFQFEEL